MGRTARGVRGIRMKPGQTVVALLTTDNENAQVLTVTEKGFGKRTEVSEYRLASRATQGVIAIKVTDKNGKLVTAQIVSDDDEIMIITSGGVLIRTRVNSIRETGRSAQGVKLIDLGKNEKLVDITTVVEREDNGNSSDDDNDDLDDNVDAGLFAEAGKQPESTIELQ